MSDLSNPIFHDEAKAREWLEARVWANGRVCPHCGVVDQSTLMQGKTTRPGLYQCNACREPFTVTVGTLYERSKVPLNKWLMVTHLMMASKKGMSALQISRMVGLSYKTTWFLCHRIRESLTGTDLAPMGGPNSPVEADETYVGGIASSVMNGSLFDVLRDDGAKRLSGDVRDVKRTDFALLAVDKRQHGFLRRGLFEGAVFRPYSGIGKRFGAHHTVNHSANEYARLGSYIHINTAENFFSIVKRGITGSFHHVSEAHLHRYMVEFDFRYNNRTISDAERMSKSISGIVGKRLTYRRIGEGGSA